MGSTVPPRWLGPACGPRPAHGDLPRFGLRVSYLEGRRHLPIVELYRAGLPAAGYVVEEGQFIDGVVAVFAFDGPNGNGDVVLSASPRGGTDVIVTFER